MSGRLTGRLPWRLVRRERLEQLREQCKTARGTWRVAEEKAQELEARCAALEKELRKHRQVEASVRELPYFPGQLSRPEVLRIFSRLDPGGELARALFSELATEIAYAAEEAADPKTAGAAEATHAAGGAYWLGQWRERLRRLLTEAHKEI